jgi:hypothetical protein
MTLEFFRSLPTAYFGSKVLGLLALALGGSTEQRYLRWSRGSLKSVLVGYPQWSHKYCSDYRLSVVA